MRKFLLFFILSVGLCVQQVAFALLNLELTRGVSGAVPIAIVPFGTGNQTVPQDMAAIIAADLQNSGRFKVFSANQLSQFPSAVQDVSFPYFRQLGTDTILVGKVQTVGIDRYQVTFQLLDAYKGGDRPLAQQTVALEHTYTVMGDGLRSLAHHISDLVYQHITGVRGIFSTRLAYILVQPLSDSKGRRYVLEVSDQDGANPKPLLVSSDPIMSPAWSPDGKQIAYVSFENKRSSIYIEDVATGNRRLVSQFPGVNGAPAWSPDGKKLALVLSKSGALNIYIMDLASRQLVQLTNDFYINTEPAWSPPL